MIRNAIMQQKYLTYIILWLLFHLSVEVNCQPIFRPKQRQWHTATFVRDRLYILDGVYLSNTTNDISEYFYLDVSTSFNTKSMSWQTLPTSIVPAHDNAASGVGGASNDTIFLYGGYAGNNNGTALVYTFETQSGIWNAPNVVGVSATRKQALTGVVNNRGKMFLFGGATVTDLTDLSDMLILDTISLSWNRGSLVNAPSAGRLNYGAVLLPDQSIMYLGN